MSAGLDMESGTTLLASRVGPSAAAEKGTSRIACDPVTISTTANLVVTKLVSRGMTYRATVGRAVERDAEPVAQQQNCSQSPACGRAVSSNPWYMTSSMARDRGRWRRGMSMLSVCSQSVRDAHEDRDTTALPR